MRRAPRYDADITISASLGEIQWWHYQGRPISYRYNPVKAIIQRALDRLDDDHCLEAYATELEKRNIPAANVIWSYLAA